MPKRRYSNLYPSVTDALNVLRKIGLEIWFKRNTAEFCDKRSKMGREIGKETHTAIEQFILTGKTEFKTIYPEEVGTALGSFALFRKEHPEVNLVAAETPLTSEKHKFNGTIDCPCPPILVDWKTGEKKDKDKPPIYDEYKYQVAAYVSLWNENNAKKIDKAYIVAIAKDTVAYNLYEMGMQEIADCFNNAFLPTLKIVTYQKWCKNAPDYYKGKE